MESKGPILLFKILPAEPTPMLLVVTHDAVDPDDIKIVPAAPIGINVVLLVPFCIGIDPNTPPARLDAVSPFGPIGPCTP